MSTPSFVARANVSSLTDRIQKDTGVERADVQPVPVRSVGVIGAGIMGAAIAVVNLKHGISVAICDASEETLAQTVRAVLEEAACGSTAAAVDGGLAPRCRPAPRIDEADAQWAACDVVIESVVENADVKRRVYGRLERHLRPQAILATNTSTLPVNGLAASLQRPERFCGMHFFNPVRERRLVEVVRGEKTNDQTIATAVAHAKQIGKLPIVVDDGPGFLVNRLLLPYMNEAIELICEGAEIEAIERAATAFGMQLGPLAMYDMIGLDTALLGGRTMWEAFPDRIVASPLLPALVKLGRLGRKSGLGFFSYARGGDRGEPDPALEAILVTYVRQRRKFTQDEILSRLFLPMLLEATRCLQERVVRDPRDIDAGVIFGLGFPPSRGGLLFWADEKGAAEVVQMLRPLEHLGKRAAPTPLLLEMARRGEKFYESDRRWR